MEPTTLAALAPHAFTAAIALGAVLFAAVSVGFSRKGPVRWVKIAALLLVLDFIAVLGWLSGFAAAARFIGIGAGVILVGTGLAFLSWRHPISKVFSPATLADCPRHARAQVERWSREIERTGFGLAAECRTVWQLQGKARHVFVRFFTHHSEPLWLEIHALDDPKVVARMAVSDRGDGRALLTADQQADQELFDDPLTTVQRVPRRATCAELIDAHRKRAMTSEGRLERIEDPVQAHVELYGAWVQRLLESGAVRRIDERWIGLAPTRIPAILLRTYAAWFH